MPNLFDPISENAKILLIGDQGHGKTGAKAALVAAGYKLRMIDTDRGFKILRSLLTDSRYPYAEYIKKAGIDLTEPGRISYIPIDVPFDLVDQTKKDKQGRTQVVENVLQPTSSAAWTQVAGLLRHWKDGDVDLGNVNDWDNDCILDFDTMSTLAEIAKYWVQDMNGHLGALEDDHGRDSGGAQEMIMRLMSKVTSPALRCNVIITGHIKRVDMSNDVPQSIEQRMRDNKSIEAQGFPAVIGKATSPYIGKKFNDEFIVKRTGNGASAERRIYAVPTDNVDAKNSVWLEPSYSLATGLAEIFCALQYKDLPTGFMEAVGKKQNQPNQSSEDKPNGPSSVGRASGFGARG